MSDMTVPDETENVEVLEFRLGENAEFAMRMGDANAPWIVARLEPTKTQATDESVADWIKLIPAEVVGNLARQVQKDLTKVEEAASNLDELHDQMVADLRDKVDVLDRQVQAMKDFATELSTEPLAGRYFAQEIERRLAEAEES